MKNKADFRTEINNTYGDNAPTIMAAFDLLRQRVKVGKQLDSPEMAAHYLQLTQAHKEREEFRVLYMDVRNRILDDRVESIGSLTEAAVYPREIIRHALAVNAHGVLLCHNHPGGDPTPSQPDRQLTAMIMLAAYALRLEVLDHVIVSSHGYHSMQQAGDLDDIQMRVNRVFTVAEREHIILR